MHSRAPAEPDVREFEAEVTAVDSNAVELEETWFYAEGGGQPADRGTVAGVAVEDVQSVDGTVRHHLADEPDVAVGDTVTGVVDDDFRTYCMRAHTASHALYGAGRRVLDDLGYGGFNIDDEKVRVDFATSTDIDDGVLVELERLVNRAVWDSRPVSWEEVPVEEAHADDEVAFNTKTEEGVMADADAVRVVTIEGWDVAACGGTHVSNTRDVGPVELLSRSNPGEGLTRVEFAVGPTAIERRARVRRAGYDAARALGVAVEDVGEAADSLAAENERLDAELQSLRSELLHSRLLDLERVEKDGERWLVGVVDGFESNDVGEAAKALTREDGVGVVAAVGAGERPFVVVAAAGGVDAGDVVTAATDEFGGGGGGGPPFAQGGGLDADPEEVVGFLRHWHAE